MISYIHSKTTIAYRQEESEKAKQKVKNLLQEGWILIGFKDENELPSEQFNKISLQKTF